jgi:hypothetical protein
MECAYGLGSPFWGWGVWPASCSCKLQHAATGAQRAKSQSAKDALRIPSKCSVVLTGLAGVPAACRQQHDVHSCGVHERRERAPEIGAGVAGEGVAGAQSVRASGPKPHSGFLCALAKPSVRVLGWQLGVGAAHRASNTASCASAEWFFFRPRGPALCYAQVGRRLTCGCRMGPHLRLQETEDGGDRIGV